MQLITIISGSFKSGAVFYIAGKITPLESDGQQYEYEAKAAIKDIELISEDKKTATFRITFKDETTILGQAKVSVFKKLKIDKAASEDSRQVDYKKVIAKSFDMPGLPDAELVKRVTKRVTLMLSVAFHTLLSCIVLGLFYLYVSEAAWVPGLILSCSIFFIIPRSRQKIGSLIRSNVSSAHGLILVTILVLFSFGHFVGMDGDRQRKEKEEQHMALASEYQSKSEELLLKAKELSEQAEYQSALTVLKPYITVLDLDGRQVLNDLNHKIDKQRNQEKLEAFKNEKPTLIAEMNRLIKDKKYEEAMNIADAHASMDDPDLKALRLKAAEDVIKQKRDEFDSTFQGNWQLYSEPSPIDDSQNVNISLRAQDMYLDRFNQVVTPMLHIRCKERKTEAVINWGTYLGLDSTSVTYRMDKQKAQRVTWGLSSNNEATFVRSPISFIQSLLKHEELYVSTTPYGENPVSVTFDIRGIKASIKPVKEACGW